MTDNGHPMNRANPQSERSGTGSEALSLHEIARRVSEVAEQEPWILAVYLFGSRTKGEAHRTSDIDLAVLFDAPRTLGDVVELEDRFARALAPALGGRDAVDLVDLRKANPFLAFDVIRGERIYCTDSYRCDNFDLYVMRRAGDLLPLERERQRMLLDPERHRVGAAGDARTSR